MLVDPFLRTIVWWCSECEKAAGADAWVDAHRVELKRRFSDPEFDPEEYGIKMGLGEAMVCPNCKYVHRDDECSSVDELNAIIVPIEEPR